MLAACSGRPSEREREREPAPTQRAEPSTISLRSVQPPPTLRPFELPDSIGGTSPQLYVGSEGLSLAWMSSAPAPSLRLANLPARNAAWSEVEIVSASPHLVINWADVPAIGETASGRLVLAWPEQHAPDAAQGHGLRVAAAQDDGSFAPAWSPDDVRHGPESGFAVFVRTAAELRLLWLDGRELLGGQAAQGRAGMQLRSVAIDDDGNQLGASELLDERTCECCKIGADVLGERYFAAYRDRSEAEVRDVYVAGLALAPTRVSEDAWTIAGCPINGPAVAVAGARAHVAWYSGAHEQSATFIAASDTLERFEPAQRFDLGMPAGRVDLLALPDDDVLISWVELDADAPGRARLLARRFTPTGELGPARFIAELGAARDWGFVRTAVLGDEVLWVFGDPSVADRPQLRGWIAAI